MAGFGPGMLAGLGEGIVQARPRHPSMSGGRRLTVHGDIAGDGRQERQTASVLCVVAGRSMEDGGL